MVLVMVMVVNARVVRLIDEREKTSAPAAGDGAAAAALMKRNELGLLLPLYNRDYSGDWKRVEKQASQVPMIAVSNVANPKGSPPSQAFIDAVKSLKASGVKEVLYYVHTRNASMPCCHCCEPDSVVFDLIDGALEYDEWIDGIFFDNIMGADDGGESDIPRHLQHYAAVVAYLKKNKPEAKVMFNGPGKHVAVNHTLAQQYMDLCDYSVWFESWEDNWQKDPWAQHYNASYLYEYPWGRFAGIAHEHNASVVNMPKDVDLAFERNIAWFLQTDNPYQQLPTYFEHEVEYIAKKNKEYRNALHHN